MTRLAPPRFLLLALLVAALCCTGTLAVQVLTFSDAACTQPLPQLSFSQPSLNYTAIPPVDPACTTPDANTSLALYCGLASNSSSAVVFQAQLFSVAGCPAGLGNRTRQNNPPPQWVLYYAATGPQGVCGPVNYMSRNGTMTRYAIVQCAASADSNGAAAVKYSAGALWLAAGVGVAWAMM